MSAKQDNLERRLRWIGQLPILLFSILLAVGLVLHVAAPGRPLSSSALNLGLVTLMLSPVVRLFLAVAERIRRRDWLFVGMTAIVVIEIAIVMWRASLKN